MKADRGFSLLMLMVIGTVVATAVSGCVVRARATADGAAQTPAQTAGTQPPRGVPPSTPPPGMPPKTPPTTREACAACGGDWGVHGLAQVESCICKTTDGGKRCRDGADCQGVCITAQEAPDFQIVTPATSSSPARGYLIGRCSDHVMVFGCNRLIPRGFAAGGPKPESEAPPVMCID